MIKTGNLARIALLLSFFFHFSQAWVPPQSDYVEDGDENDHQATYRGDALDVDGPRSETVQEYRERNGIDYAYNAAFISNELCRDVDEIDCAEMDFSFYTKALHTRSIAKANNGVIKVLSILVRWAGETKTLHDRADYETLWNGVGKSSQSSGPIPTGSVRWYIELNSYGNVLVDADVVDWVTTNGTEEYYANLPYISRDEDDMRGAWHFVLEKLDDEGFDFSPYDTDQDGFLDAVVFIHSGYGAENGDDRCEGEAIPPGDLIPLKKKRVNSHATPGEQHKIWQSKDQKYRMGNYAINTGYRGKCTNNLARLNVLTHEFLHTFGLPDTYGHCGGRSGMGAYDIMAKVNGVTGRPAYPPFMSPWTKYTLGWVDPIEITADGTYTAGPSAKVDDIFILKQGYKENEYLLIENRMPYEWERDLWNHGILIYHVDETIQDHGGLLGWSSRDRGFPNLPFSAWPGSGEHYRVALLAPDGRYDLEKCRNHGDADDFFSQPEQALRPGNGEFVATDAGTYPNTDSYVGGQIEVTGITISNFRRVENSDSFSFDVSGIDAMFSTRSPTEAPTNTPTHSPTAIATDSPTNQPSEGPTQFPTGQPSHTSIPTGMPSTTESSVPTDSPTDSPTGIPTFMATDSPTISPTSTPSSDPTNRPTAKPTGQPTNLPTELPSSLPTSSPTQLPSSQPSYVPSSLPTGSPSTGSPTQTAPEDMPTSHNGNSTGGFDGRDDAGGDTDASVASVPPSTSATPSMSLMPSASLLPSASPTMAPTTPAGSNSSQTESDGSSAPRHSSLAWIGNLLLHAAAVVSSVYFVADVV